MSIREFHVCHPLFTIWSKSSGGGGVKYKSGQVLKNFRSCGAKKEGYLVAYSVAGENFWVFGCSKVLVIDVNEYFSAAGDQNAGYLYQMSTFSYWYQHLQSLESNNFRASGGLYLL